jgi:septum formation protein
MQLILASTSRYRAELLQRLGLAFSTLAPEVDETRQPDETADQLVRRLSLAKARAVAVNSTDALVIGSDQVAVCGDQILGKPGSETRAIEQLQALAGNSVNFLTGLALVNTATGQHQLSMVTTPVHFRGLTTDQIEEYVRREQPLDCAGAFKSEGLGIALFRAIGGNDPSALIGLPLIELCEMLYNENFDVLARRDQSHD